MTRILSLLLLTLLPSLAWAQDVDDCNVHMKWRTVKDHQDGGHPVAFQSWYAFNAMPGFANLDPNALPPAPATLDLAKNTPLAMHLNNRYGDCYYAAIVHLFEVWYGLMGVPVTFTDTGKANSIERRYLTLSGGDNGLSDQDVQGEMMKASNPYQGYTADVPGTGIIDYLYIDPNNADAMKRSMCFGPVIYTFTVANNWINNSGTGAIWDASTYRANNNGHAVIFAGYDSEGKYKLYTWGTYVWITPAGVRVSSPTAWVAFSVKSFNEKGLDYAGVHIVDRANQWRAAGGKAIPSSIISLFPPKDVPPAIPVITSPLSAFAQVGVQFTYQITATNSPTSYATPGNSFIVSATGLVSGTVKTAGSYNVPITATNASGTGTATLALTVTDKPVPPPIGGATITLGSDLKAGTYEVHPAGTKARLDAWEAWLKSMPLPPADKLTPAPKPKETSQIPVQDVIRIIERLAEMERRVDALAGRETQTAGR